MRKETIERNGERIEKAKNEKEMWNIVNDVTSSKKTSEWKLKEGNNYMHSIYMIYMILLLYLSGLN